MPESPQILALDPATKCGFAHSCGTSGTWDLSVRRDESAGMRLFRLRSKLSEVHQGAPFGIVAFEAARHAAPGMQGALVTQAEFQSVIKLWCHDRGIESFGVSPSEVKKFATGKGNSNKDKMKAAAIERFGVKCAEWDDNEVDAKWILEMATERLRS